MELNLNIEYEQLLFLIKQLPEEQIEKLKKDIEITYRFEQSENEISEFQKFLLDGQVMSEEQYNSFLENRKQFNQWRTK